MGGEEGDGVLPISDVNLKGKVSVGLNLEGKKHPRSDWCRQMNNDPYLCVHLYISVYGIVVSVQVMNVAVQKCP